MRVIAFLTCGFTTCRWRVAPHVRRRHREAGAPLRAGDYPFRLPGRRGKADPKRTLGVSPPRSLFYRAQRESPVLRGPGFRGKTPGDDLLLHGLGHTTIGAAAFHFRVRDGIGWFHSAMVARERVEGRGIRVLSGRGAAPASRKLGSSERVVAIPRRRVVEGKATRGYMIKPHGSLVLVSSTRCRAYTPSLSTTWS